MKCIALLFVPLLAFGIGCNTAQVSQPAPRDAGPPCQTKLPVITCDAGAVTPGACSGGVSLALNYPDASATLPAGSYQLGCTVGFFVNDPASPDCIRAPSCTCVPPDAGVTPSEDAGEAGAAEEAGTEADAGAGGPLAPGSWSCFATQ